MFTRCRQGRLFTCLIGLLLAAACQMAIAQDEPSAQTHVDYVRQQNVLWTKAILDVYDATARAEEAWHDDARQFIQVYIDVLSDPYLALPFAGRLRQAELMGRHLLADGCDEPIIRILYGRVLMAHGMHGEAMPFLQAGYDAARNTPGLELLLGSTAIRLAYCDQLLGRGDGSQYYDQAVTALAAAVGDTRYGEDDQGPLLDMIDAFYLQELPSIYVADLVERCANESESREWTCKMLAGIMYLDQITIGRGRSYRSNDTDLGHRRSQDYGSAAIDAARLFDAAWQLRPERPQAAARMILLAGVTDSDLIDSDLWLDRATPDPVTAVVSDRH